MKEKIRQVSLPMFLLLGILVLPQLAFASRRSNPQTRNVQAIVTAYTSSRHSVTASGAHVSEGFAACPRRYPFGTRLKIQGRMYECQDRLNSKYDSRFDIWKPTRVAASAFGKRRLTVVLISEGRT
jgi:3D (Asp-Asp-Asp) domain-containing protein